MKRILIAVLCIAVLTSVTHAEEITDKPLGISGPWLWTIAPATDGHGHLHTDFLSLTSDGAITEKDVAVNAPRRGDSVGDYKWQNGELTPGTGHDNISALVHKTFGELPMNSYMFYGLIRIYFPPESPAVNSPYYRTTETHHSYPKSYKGLDEWRLCCYISTYRWCISAKILD